MPLYHFHIRENGSSFEDEAGRDYADGPAAKQEAIETAAALAKEAFTAGSSDRVTLEVTEEQKPFLRISITLEVDEQIDEG